MSALLSEKYQQWEQECDARFRRLKSNEEELNRIFIRRYGLQQILSPEEDETAVTVRRADLQREIRSLISYAIGCLFGRYSVDVPGLCFAGGQWNAALYRTIQPEPTNILPLPDLFENNLTDSIIRFVRLVYGEDTLEENLLFIAGALGGTGAPREILQEYLFRDFFADHCRIYQKRPIYWMFSSGRRNSFKALVYLHRWNGQTTETIRKDYIQPLQAFCRRNHDDKMLEELEQYEEKLYQLRNILLHLDDGVLKNYEKLSSVLEKIR